MKTTYLKMMFALLLSILVFACNTDDAAIEEETIQEEFGTEQILTRAEVNALINSGMNPLIEDELYKTSFTLGGKTTNGLIIGDVFLSDEELQDMVQAQEAAGNNRAWVDTRSRITLPEYGRRTLRIGAVINGPDALPLNHRIAIEDAVHNYNRVYMRKLNMEYVEVTGFEAFSAQADENGPLDTVLFYDSANVFVSPQNPDSGVEARAGFPFNGNPSYLIGFGDSTLQRSINYLIQLSMHELGHTIGLRHSDWQTKRSCGGLNPALGLINENLDTSGVACVIAGTNPSGDQVISIMRSCGSGNLFADPDFAQKDKDALRVLYDQVDFPCANENTEPLPNYCIEDQYIIDLILENSTNAEISFYVQIGLICLDPGDF